MIVVMALSKKEADESVVSNASLEIVKSKSLTKTDNPF